MLCYRYPSPFKKGISSWEMKYANQMSKSNYRCSGSVLIVKIERYEPIVLALFKVLWMLICLVIKAKSKSYPISLIFISSFPIEPHGAVTGTQCCYYPTRNHTRLVNRLCWELEKAQWRKSDSNLGMKVQSPLPGLNWECITHF